MTCLTKKAGSIWLCRRLPPAFLCVFCNCVCPPFPWSIYADSPTEIFPRGCYISIFYIQLSAFHLPTQFVLLLLFDCDIFKLLNSVYTRSGQNSTPNSNATNLHSSQKRCCSFCISSSNASPTFQVQKSIFHQMTKPIQVTVILPLLLAISFSRNDDIHSSISGISNDLIGVIPTIGQ